MTRLACLIVSLLFAVNASAATISQRYTAQSHSYLWRADGSSTTQGTASIENYPTVTSGTASVTMSQVTVSPTGTMPPGSGSLIKAVLSGGASGATVQVYIKRPSTTVSKLGNIGFYWYQDSTGNTVQTGLNFYLGITGFSKYVRFAANTGTAVQRRISGWNHFVFQRGDEAQLAGGFSWDSDTPVFVRMDFVIAANQTGTVYFGDVMYGFYAKPQIVVWSADNAASGEPYTSMAPYMKDRGIPGTYCPSTDWMGTSGAVTWEQLQSLVADGWSVSGHNTAGQTYTSLTEAQLDTEVATIKAAFAANNIPLSPVWCFNGGAHNATVDTVMARNGITHGYSANVGQDKNGRFLYGGLINPYNLWSVSADALTEAEVKTAINHAIRYGEHLGLLWHDTAANFAGVMNYLYVLKEANVIDVTTWDRLVQRQTNPRKLRATGN